MRLILITAALLAATGAAAQTAPADGQRSPEARAEGRAKLMAADTDKDGKWSKEEWLAAGRREAGFDRLDTNKDGFVTQDELRAGMQKMMERSSTK